MPGTKIETKVDFSGPSLPLKTLLARLAADQEAAPAYEQLRLRLVTFFRRQSPVDAEALADEAIDRLARRLDDGTPVDNIAGYALGIARFIAMEVEARRRKETLAAREVLHELEWHAPEAATDPALPALKICLESIDPESARLILEYYALDGGASRIARRQQLAERSGMTLNALRNRALRTRMTLEKCVKARLGADKAHLTSDIPAKLITRHMPSSDSSGRTRDDVYD